MPRYKIYMCDVICEYRFNRSVSYVTIENIILQQRPDVLDIPHNRSRVTRGKTKKEADRLNPVRVVYKKFIGMSNDIKE